MQCKIEDNRLGGGGGEVESVSHVTEDGSEQVVVFASLIVYTLYTFLILIHSVYIPNPYTFCYSVYILLFCSFVNSCHIYIRLTQLGCVPTRILHTLYIMYIMSVLYLSCLLLQPTPSFNYNSFT